jgi:hypothetical protein
MCILKMLHNNGLLSSQLKNTFFADKKFIQDNLDEQKWDCTL